MALKYGASAYATFIGPLSNATTVLGAPEANARKSLNESSLPQWKANWRLCTDETVPPNTGKVNSYQSTVHYGTYDIIANGGVLTSAVGFSTTYAGNNAAYLAPSTIMTANINDLVYASTTLGFSNANVYIRRVTK